MEHVSLKVAKVIKEAGYPQIFVDCAYYEDNKLHHTEDPYNNCHTIIAYAPTYLEVWLWLWREKGFRFELAHPEYNGEYDFDKLYCNITSGSGVTDDYSDPEKPIIAAVEYLVDNSLLK